MKTNQVLKEGVNNDLTSNFNFIELSVTSADLNLIILNEFYIN